MRVKRENRGSYPVLICVDGLFRNEAIRILLPENLRAIEKGIRVAGFGPRVGFSLF
jgi:hypothetical protein